MASDRIAPALSAPPSEAPARAGSLGADVVDLRSYFLAQSFASGTIIYKPGDPADRIHLLRRGRVRLLRVRPKIDPALLAILRPGELFGEVLRPANATMEDLAVASGDTEVWTVESRDLSRLLEARPSLALDIVRALGERVAQLRHRVISTTFKGVPERLADAILTLAASHGERCPHGAEVDLKGVTQQDFADMIGASRSFVSTLVNEMKRDGLLRSVGRTVCIANGKALRALAERDCF